MLKVILFFILFTLRLAYHPDYGKGEKPEAEIKVTQPAPAPKPLPASFTSFKASLKNKKVVLYWAVKENETASQFEVEKSADGVNFKLTALVFSSDKPADASYQFYEKAGNQKMTYRIKLINRNSGAEYSPVVEINPKA